jgi:hypothetical protein
MAAQAEYAKGEPCYYINRDGYFLGSARILTIVPPEMRGEASSYVISVTLIDVDGRQSIVERHTVVERLQSVMNPATGIAFPQPPLPPNPATAPVIACLHTLDP